MEVVIFVALRVLVVTFVKLPLGEAMSLATDKLPQETALLCIELKTPNPLALMLAQVTFVHT